MNRPLTSILPNDRFDVTTAKTTNRPQNEKIAMDGETSRLDAIAKVTGAAKYSMDRIEGRPLVAAFVRCPWGRADFLSADVDAAKKIPGVVEVDVEGQIGGTFTYNGANAGHIAAESVSSLQRGLQALNAQWKRLEALCDLNAARPEWPKLSQDEQTRVDAALAGADFVLDAVYSTQVQTHSALETHGGRVDYLGDKAVVYGSTQSNFGFRDGLKQALGLGENAVEMHCEYVGGGFGAKFGPGKEGLLAANLSKKFNRPCIVFCSRREEHLDTGNRPSTRQRFRLGVRKDGTIVGGCMQTLGGVGVGGGGGLGEPRYDLGDVVRKHADVSFNGGAPRAFRAPGNPQSMFAVELAMEEIAAGIGMDSLELRRRCDPSENRRKMFDRGAELIGWNRRTPTGSQKGTVRRGFGIGVADWPNIITRGEAEVVIHPDGSIEARSGTQDIGQGQRTTMGVVAAHHLGVPLAFVESKVGTTDLPIGPASGGSMTAPNTAPAMIGAALDVRTQLLSVVGESEKIDPSELQVRDGRIYRADKVVVEWKEACRLLSGAITGRGRFDRGHQDHHGDGRNSEGAQFVELVVDTETGVIRVVRIVAIQACGKVVCRKTAESQIIGGVIQGVSYAMFEDRILDRQTAAMVNPNLEMYKIAGARDIPEIMPVLWDEGATGVRSLGEPPTIPTSGAIAAAVFNAIGAPVRSLPLTPDKVLAALAAAAGKGGGA